MSEVSGSDVPSHRILEYASEDDLDILNRHLYTASRWAFGELFEKMPCNFNRTFMLVDDGVDLGDEVRPEFEQMELTAVTERKTDTALQIASYAIALVSLESSNHVGYHTAISREFEIDPNIPNGTSKTRAYLYGANEDNPVTVTPNTDIPKSLPNNDRRPYHRPKYLKFVEEVESNITKEELRQIYDGLKLAGFNGLSIGMGSGPAEV
ncbi:MAG TPA: hypothetical protein VLF39_00515 [Candidatus Saccharimonadales bacterium]|nr:hypothetical protein [Candidatus Saccharimonadales bacterium]